MLVEHVCHGYHYAVHDSLLTQGRVGTHVPDLELLV
jgi:hypothetical protein